MTLVLPDAVDGLDAVEARLTPTALEKWIGAARGEDVVVSLPKLEIDPADALSLGATLSAMGMPLAFDRKKADLTGIANPPDPDERLFISDVFHKAHVKIDEKSTEAAAATAVVVAASRPSASGSPEPPPKEFKADHPFLFMVRDLRSGLVLFMGRVADPATR